MVDIKCVSEFSHIDHLRMFRENFVLPTEITKTNFIYFNRFYSISAADIIIDIHLVSAPLEV